MYNDFNIQPTMCKICKRQASKIEEYIQLAKECGYKTVDECVENEEGTFNPDTRKFYCTECYIKIGQPLGTA